MRERRRCAVYMGGQTVLGSHWLDLEEGWIDYVLGCCHNSEAARQNAWFLWFKDSL